MAIAAVPESLVTTEAVPFERDALAWLVNPESSARFRAEVFEQRWSVTARGDHSRFAPLLSVETLDRVVGTFGLKFPDIRMVALDRDVPREDYTFRGDLIDPLRVGALFASGCTVIFNSLHERHAPLQRLTAALSAQTGLRTQTNIYLTPPGSQGFQPHWDTHDVFVLQVEGTKHWRMYGGGPSLPLTSHIFKHERDKVGPETADFTLQAGDTLYIPRGVMHAAAATDTISLHITLGVIPQTWADWITSCITEVTQRDPSWRASLPLDVSPETTARLVAELADRIRALPSQIVPEAVLQEARDEVLHQSRPTGPDFLRQSMAANTVASDAIVERRAGLPIELLETDTGWIVRAAARELVMPARAGRLLARVVAGGPVALDHVDDGLDAESRGTVIAALVREGFLATVLPSHS
jgi:hypothetical protein